MRATMLTAVRGIELRHVADPVIRFPTDAVVTVTASCVCGSDLHGYRGHAATVFPRRIGHEFIGVVSGTGSEVAAVAVGDLVIAPFAISDGTLVRVGAPVDDQLTPDLLALSDVMGTGHHAAASAGVKPGCTVVVVGDGAVGLCAVLASARLGAGRVIAMSRRGSRQKLATEFGATDIIAERGQDGAARVMDLLAGVGADCVLECVGTQDSFDQAVAVTRPGGMIGCVGAPFYDIPAARLAGRNIGLRGGVAPVRAYLPALLADVLAGLIRPGRVFDLELPLADVAEAYRAMDERRAIKVLLRP